MVADLVQRLVSQAPELRMAARLRDFDRRTVGSPPALVVLTGLDEAATPDDVTTTHRRPRVLVLGVSESSGRALLYELQSEPAVLGELTSELLAQVEIGRAHV